MADREPDDDARNQWQRVKAMLAQALEQPDATRDAWLRQAAGVDLALLNEVKRLLALHNDETLSINHAPLIAELLESGARRLAAGDRMGAWTLERPLGEGGMGSVWLAHRTEESFVQLAAVKVIRGVASDILLARLRSERRALAALNHPNIAHLIDGGETAAGVPYIVMEYVDGQPIDGWCDTRKPDARDCLSLMMQLVGAVAHAHEHLLVHRDIKPSNVLVTAEGKVKLLDFGVAKLLANDGETRALTERDDRVLTPQYASPEQVQGKAITVATDVYGLGATLFRMLTGVAPFGDVARDPFALLKAIVENVPTRTSAVLRNVGVNDSTRSTVKMGAAALTGDIDTIVMKALAKLPAERYATALDLGRDIEAYLGGYPIAARRPTWIYVARKFVARNRLASAALVAAVVSLFAGLGSALWQAERATVQRDIAQREEARAIAALAVAQTERQSTAEALALAERERATAVAATGQAQSERAAAQASAAQATIAQQLAEAQRLLAAKRFSEVRALANRVVREYADDLLGTYGTTETRLKIINDSVGFLDRLRTDARGDAELLGELSRGYRKLAFALSGDASMQDFPRASAQLGLARQLRQQVIQARGSTREDKAELALIDGAEGELARQQYRFAEAGAKLASARLAFAGLPGWSSDDPWDRMGPARAALFGAWAVIEPGASKHDSVKASALLDEAQNAIERILGVNAESTTVAPITRFHLSLVHYARALMRRQLGDLGAADVDYDRAEQAIANLVNQHPNNAIYVQHWSSVLGARKMVRMANGQDAAGFADGLKRAELATLARAREPGNPLAILGDVVAWSQLCSDYQRLEKNNEQAHAACQHAMEGARAMLAVRQVDPFAGAAYQAMMVAGVGGIQAALKSAASDQPLNAAASVPLTAIGSALQAQREGLTGLTRLTPAITDDPLRSAYLANSRLAVAHGLELAGRHAEATRVLEENLNLIDAVHKANVAQPFTPGLKMFTLRRMAHNFLAESRSADTFAENRLASIERSQSAAKRYLEVAAEARSRNQLSAMFAKYVGEMERLTGQTPP